jgi:hypothetical protein
LALCNYLSSPSLAARGAHISPYIVICEDGEP